MSPTIWIEAGVLEAVPDGGAALKALVKALDRNTLNLSRGESSFSTEGIEFFVTQLFSADVVAVLGAQKDGKLVSAPTQRRPLLVPAEGLATMYPNRWPAAEKVLLDASNIDESKARKGLRFVREQAVYSIFAPGGHHRLYFHYTDEPQRQVVVLGIHDADAFTSHSASAQLAQPTRASVKAWQTIEQVATTELTNFRASRRTRTTASAATVRPSAPPRSASVPPPRDTWITVVKLRSELGISDPEVQSRVLAARSTDDLADCIGLVPDATFDRLERAFEIHQKQRLRQNDTRLSEIEVVQLSQALVLREGIETLDEALRRLTPDQRRVVEMQDDKPVRLKGGPGTGKTRTALLRAGFLARRAEKQGEALRIAIFVFNSDLAARITELAVQFGLGGYLQEDAQQRIVVSSLHDWCARLIDLGRLRLEPLDPYRADAINKNREAAIELALEEGRKLLAGPSFEPLWERFDARGAAGRREIETEISQFIKARTITDKDTYLTARRPEGWWLKNEDRAFRLYVWEVARIYDETLQRLGFIDADDMTNDAIKEVSKISWRNVQKEREGFDYLILDEAQDFFRNQLTLVGLLAKRADRMMLCYDENQAVYARHPSLRDIGFETAERFQTRHLQENFRSTHEIVALLNELRASYPLLGMADNWGEFRAATDFHGPRPTASGFETADGMLDQAVSLVREALASGARPHEVAILAFDEELVNRSQQRLEEADFSTHRMTGKGRVRPGKNITVTSARTSKGQQYQVVVLVGVGRDRLPDFSGVKDETHRERVREDALREFVVAVSRCQRELHLLWEGPEPTEFVTALRSSVDRTA